MKHGGACLRLRLIQVSHNWPNTPPPREGRTVFVEAARDRVSATLVRMLYRLSMLWDVPRLPPAQHNLHVMMWVPWHASAIHSWLVPQLACEFQKH